MGKDDCDSGGILDRAAHGWIQINSKEWSCQSHQQMAELMATIQPNPS
jgi:hypothetical protein